MGLGFLGEIAPEPSEDCLLLFLAVAPEFLNGRRATIEELAGLAVERPDKAFLPV